MLRHLCMISQGLRIFGVVEICAFLMFFHNYCINFPEIFSSGLWAVGGCWRSRPGWSRSQQRRATRIRRCACRCHGSPLPHCRLRCSWCLRLALSLARRRRVMCRTKTCCAVRRDHRADSQICPNWNSRRPNGHEDRRLKTKWS